MKKIVYLALFALLFLGSCTSTKKITAPASQPTAEDRLMSIASGYEVQTMGVGTDGTYLIKVTDYFPTSDERVYIEGLKKDAVHCVIFKGIPAGNGSLKQPALRTNDTKIEDKEQAFHDFFANKQYLNFVSSIVNSSKTITRIQGSKNFKISLTMSVDKDKLRKYLTDNNMIKSLNYIF